MGVTPEKLFDLLYNKKLPQLYRDEDSKIGYPLKRYLESLVEGGYKGAIDDIQRVLLLFDPMAIPENLFPFLCESFGIEYLPDIDVKYQRKFILNLGELVRRRGTFSSVHYMVRALTGLETELHCDGSTLSIVLLAKKLDQVNILIPSMGIIGNYIQTQIPYYITPAFSARVDSGVIESKSYAHSAMCCTKYYQLGKEE